MKINTILHLCLLAGLGFGLAACGGGAENTASSNAGAGDSSHLPTAIAADSWRSDVNLQSRADQSELLVEDLGESLKITVTYPDILNATNSQVYLNTDNNVETGFRFNNEAWGAIGADYIIENGLLFKSTADDSSWSWDMSNTDITYFQQTETSIEIEIDKSRLEEPCSALQIGVMGRDSDWMIEVMYPLANELITVTLAACIDDHDSIPPEITLNGASSIEIVRGNLFTDPGATATDNVDGDITADIQVSGNVDTDTLGSYALTYTVTDSSGNAASADRIVIVKEETTDSSQITVDGLFDDWGRVLSTTLPVSEGELKIHEADSQIFMNLLITHAEVRDSDHLQIFLDTDNDINTGYQVWSKANGGVVYGADYLIENGHLNQYVGSSGYGWNWEYDVENIEYEKVSVNASHHQYELAFPASIINADKVGIWIFGMRQSWNERAGEYNPFDWDGLYPLRSVENNSFTANDDNENIENDKVNFIDVLANDDDEALLSRIIVSPGYGTATINDEGYIEYQTNNGYIGEDSFVYEVLVGTRHTDFATVNLNVAPPVRAIDDDVSMLMDETITIELLANDYLEGNDTAPTLNKIVTQPEHGQLEVGDNGVVIYQPDEGYTGTDSFEYQIKGLMGFTDTASVTIEIDPIPNRQPDAVEDAFTTPFNESVVIDVLANDVDPDGDNIDITDFTQPSEGLVSLAVDGQFVFDPQGNIGSLTFYYTISDGNGGTDTAAVTIASTDPDDGNYAWPQIENENVTVKEGESITIDVLANDTDSDGDTLILDQIDSGSLGTTQKDSTGTKVIYTSTGGTGTDEFYYGVHDGYGHNGAGKVTVTIIP